MEYIERSIQKQLQDAIARKRSILLLGPRQTGKTTLTNFLDADMRLSMVRPGIRQRYEQEPDLLIAEVEKISEMKEKPILLVLDEVQKVPVLLDCVQDLIDRNVAQCVLLGSSARKLRRGADTNLLPGRVLSFKLDPLTYVEYPEGTLEERLVYGTLPAVSLIRDAGQKREELQSYVITYLEEEVRAEAIVRNLSAFGRFLELAAGESGYLVSFRKLSQEIGVSHTTIQSYYQILEDCLIVERIDPLTKSKTRRKLTRSSKYMFFDLGIRHASAKGGFEPLHDQWGHLFEQYVGLELIRYGRKNNAARLHFWRDPGGPEIDWVLKKGQELVPIEVKWSDAPKEKDAKHIALFLSEYPEAKKGYVICRTPRSYDLSQNITALPWQELMKVIE